jgi:hypothetical protein
MTSCFVRASFLYARRRNFISYGVGVSNVPIFVSCKEFVEDDLLTDLLETDSNHHLRQRNAALVKELAEVRRHEGGLIDDVRRLRERVRELEAEDIRTENQELRAKLHNSTRVCVVCGTDFTTKRADALTCSPACRTKKSRKCNG